jgi:hypothetical protein
MDERRKRIWTITAVAAVIIVGAIFVIARVGERERKPTEFLPGERLDCPEGDLIMAAHPDILMQVGRPTDLPDTPGQAIAETVTPIYPGINANALARIADTPAGERLQLRQQGDVVAEVEVADTPHGFAVASVTACNSFLVAGGGGA